MGEELVRLPIVEPCLLAPSIRQRTDPLFEFKSRFVQTPYCNCIEGRKGEKKKEAVCSDIQFIIEHHHDDEVFGQPDTPA